MRTTYLHVPRVITSPKGGHTHLAGRSPCFLHTTHTFWAVRRPLTNQHRRTARGLVECEERCTTVCSTVLFVADKEAAPLAGHKC